MAEGVGFEPTEPVRVLLISSQVPLTTQPPFRSMIPLASLFSQMVPYICLTISCAANETVQTKKVIEKTKPPFMQE